MKTLILSLKLLLCLFVYGLSQNSEWINYTNGDYITTLEFEGDYIWIGTWGGLVQINRTTGETFFYDKINSELPDNHIRCIAIDASGNKWITTRNGLVKFDGTDWTVYDAPDLVFINYIVIDNSSNKWIATWDGVVKFNDGNWTIYNESNSELPDRYVNCIAIDASGNKWIGTWEGGLAKFDGTDWTVYDTSNSDLPSNRVLCITIDESGNKWIGTEPTWSTIDQRDIGGGLVKFNDTNWTVYNDSNSALPSNYVECISIDNSGNKWITTSENWNAVELDKALVKFNDTNWTVYNTNNLGLQGSNTSVLMIDETGIIWIGNCTANVFGNVGGYGLYTFDGTNLTKVNTSSSGLTHNNVDCIAIDNSGNKWIGIGGWITGLVKFDGFNWTVYDTANSGFPDDNARYIEIDNSGNLWIGSIQGLIKFDGVNWIIYDTTNSGLPSNSVSCMAIDKTGNKWIGTFDKGLVKFDGAQWTVYNQSNSGISISYISYIAIDIDGSIWFASNSEGLTRFDGMSWVTYTQSNSGLPENNVYFFAIDEIGNKWIGCLHEGLVKFDNTNWTIYNESNSGLPDNYVISIAFDNSGNKWIGTQDGGLAKFDNTNWTVYNTSNSGLSTNLISCIVIDNHNNKWIGTPWNGLYVFNEGGVVSVDENRTDRETLQNAYVLSQNYPNPFNQSTIIHYSIPKQSHVTLKVYNVLGSIVTTLVNKEQPQGTYEIEFNATGLKSGIYFYKLQVGNNFVDSKGMLLMK